MTDEEERITNVLKTHLRAVGCSLCEGDREKLYCRYCTPIQHNNMWNISTNYARSIAQEIIKEQEKDD